MTFFRLLIDKLTVVQELEFFLRIVVSCMCGALIGYERTRRFKEAGIRTHILVACAAALMMLVSKYGFADLQVGTNGFFAGSRGADAARIAAQVVSGISFLGAGVIFKAGGSVRGLTTAAGIWATAGIGLAIGAGMYFEGIFVTLLVFVSQYLMHKITVGKDSVESADFLIVVRDSDDFRKRFEALMAEKNATVFYNGITKNENGTTQFHVSITLPRKEGLSDLVFYADEDENVLRLETQAGNEHPAKEPGR